MDMTMAEQLVWAAMFAEIRSKGKTLVDGRLEDDESFVARCCVAATAAVFDLRSLTKKAFNDDIVRSWLGRPVFEHVRQMTYKADD